MDRQAIVDERVMDVWEMNISMDDDQAANEARVDALLEQLARAIGELRTRESQQSPDIEEYLALVCHLGREVVKAAYVSPSAALWSDDREERSVQLLKKAAGATKGSETYGVNTAGYPGAFRDALKSLQADDQAWASMQGLMKKLEA